MIEKLKQNDRIEFLLKENRINNRYYNNRIINFVVGSTGIVLLKLNYFGPGSFLFLFFLIGSVIDIIILKKSKAKLISEYFEIKPKEKRK